MTRGKRRHRSSAAPVRPRPAAGLLLRYTDHEGAWYLLGKRHRRLGGTWANIGGYLKPWETAIVGAQREFLEETAIDVAWLTGVTIAQELKCGTSAVPYTLFVVDVPNWIENFRLSSENDELCWWHADAIADLPLHEGFALAWAALRVENV